MNERAEGFEIKTIMVVGDSLSMVRTTSPTEQGPLISEKDLAVPLRCTYPVLISQQLTGLNLARLFYVYNRAERGNGIRDVDKDIVYNALFCQPEVLIFHFGANDCRLRSRGGALVQITPLPEFTTYLHRIASALTFSNAFKIVISIAPPTTALELRRPGYRNEVGRFNGALREFSNQCGCVYVDLGECLSGCRLEDYILEDGYHFNKNMHLLLAKYLIDALREASWMEKWQVER